MGSDPLVANTDISLATAGVHLLPLCAGSISVSQGATREVSCNGMRGRYLAIRIATANYLTICGVSVWTKHRPRPLDQGLHFLESYKLESVAAPDAPAATGLPQARQRWVLGCACLDSRAGRGRISCITYHWLKALCART